MTPWRSAIAQWSEPRRERWGRRANELEAQGLSWLAAEERAFEELEHAPEMPEVIKPDGSPKGRPAQATMGFLFGRASRKPI